ncbi:MAG: RNA polymerase sigma factor [Candidatus Aminicenantales bacterium]
MTEIELVKSCLEGNVESYRGLMNKYSESAMAVALNILLNYEDAEDACQEAFLRAYQNLKKFDLKKNFKNWFYAILLNLCVDRIRKKKRFHHFLSRLQRKEMERTVIRPVNPAAGPVLETKFLRHLSPRERISLYLWSQEGCSGAEIASILGCSLSTAHVYLFRARTKLRVLMREKENEKMSKD